MATSAEQQALNRAFQQAKRLSDYLKRLAPGLGSGGMEGVSPEPSTQGRLVKPKGGKSLIPLEKLEPEVRRTLEKLASLPAEALVDKGAKQVNPVRFTAWVKYVLAGILPPSMRKPGMLGTEQGGIVSSKNFTPEHWTNFIRHVDTITPSEIQDVMDSLTFQVDQISTAVKSQESELAKRLAKTPMIPMIDDQGRVVTDANGQTLMTENPAYNNPAQAAAVAKQTIKDLPGKKGMREARVAFAVNNEIGRLNETLTKAAGQVAVGGPEHPEFRFAALVNQATKAVNVEEYEGKQGVKLSGAGGPPVTGQDAARGVVDPNDPYAEILGLREEGRARLMEEAAATNVGQRVREFTDVSDEILSKKLARLAEGLPNIDTQAVGIKRGEAGLGRSIASLLVDPEYREPGGVSKMLGRFIQNLRRESTNLGLELGLPGLDDLANGLERAHALGYRAVEDFKTLGAKAANVDFKKVFDPNTYNKMVEQAFAGLKDPMELRAARVALLKTVQQGFAESEQVFRGAGNSTAAKNLTALRRLATDTSVESIYNTIRVGEPVLDPVSVRRGQTRMAEVAASRRAAKALKEEAAKAEAAAAAGVPTDTAKGKPAPTPTPGVGTKAAGGAGPSAGPTTPPKPGAPGTPGGAPPLGPQVPEELQPQVVTSSLGGFTENTAEAQKAVAAKAAEKKVAESMKLPGFLTRWIFGLNEQYPEGKPPPGTYSKKFLQGTLGNTFLGEMLGIGGLSELASLSKGGANAGLGLGTRLAKGLGGASRVAFSIPGALLLNMLVQKPIQTALSEQSRLASTERMMDTAGSADALYIAAQANNLRAQQAQQALAGNPELQAKLMQQLQERSMLQTGLAPGDVLGGGPLGGNGPFENPTGVRDLIMNR